LAGGEGYEFRLCVLDLGNHAIFGYSAKI